MSMSEKNVGIILQAISKQFSQLLQTQNHYFYLLLPATPEIMQKAWGIPLIHAKPPHNPKSSQFWAVFAQQISIMQPTSFVFATADLELPFGFFIYAIAPKILAKLPAVFWGGKMVAQINKREFSAKNFPENFWAGTFCTPQMQEIQDFLAASLKAQGR